MVRIEQLRTTEPTTPNVAGWRASFHCDPHHLASLTTAGCRKSALTDAVGALLVGKGGFALPDAIPVQWIWGVQICKPQATIMFCNPHKKCIRARVAWICFVLQRPAAPVGYEASSIKHGACMTWSIEKFQTCQAVTRKLWGWKRFEACSCRGRKLFSLMGASFLRRLHISGRHAQ